MGRLRSCLEPAGAALRLISSPHSLSSLESLVAQEAVVLTLDGDLVKQATPPEQKWIKQVYSFLKNHEVRAVQDSEIGFALLHISTEEHCNPKSNPKLPAATTPMVPPTLSQAPPSQQPHSSSHPHTLPFTQDHEPPLAHTTTILAPDSIDQSQPAGPAPHRNSSSSLRVNETILTAKSQSDKSPSNKSPLLDKSSVLVKNEELPPSPQVDFDVTQLQGKSPVRGSSKQLCGKDKHPPFATRDLAPAIENVDKSQLGISKSPLVGNKGTRGKDKCSAEVTDSHTASLSTAVSVKTPEKCSVKAPNKEVKTEPLDFLFGDEEEMEEGPAPSVIGRGGEGETSVNEQGHPHDGRENVLSPAKSAPASKSAEKNPSPISSSLLPCSPSQPEGSVIVPCSLTPRTQDKTKKPPLPDSQTLALAFGGHRRKRSHVETAEDVEKESKRNKVEEEREVGDGGGKVGRGEKEGGNSGELGKGGTKERGAGKEGKDGAESPSVWLFSGLKSERTSKSATSAEESKPQLPPIMAGLPLLETNDGITTTNMCENTTTAVCKTEGPSLAQDTLDYQSEMMKLEPIHSEEREMEVQPPSDMPSQSPPPTTQAPPTTQMTQAAPPNSPDPALFLSARKRRRKSQRDDVAPTPAVQPPATASSSRAVSPHTQLTVATQATQRSRMFTPFTSLVVTGGRRSKASDQEHTNLWEEIGRGQLDEEDPLVNAANEEAPKKIYKPVCDENGFVCSRIRPRVQTSRAGRLAAFADSQLSNHSDTPDTGGGGGGGQLAEVVYTSLVVAEGRKERERGRKKNTGQRSGGKNFKKFRKVRHIGQGAIPRLVGLKEYVPPTSRELQEWMEEMETAGGEGGGGEQDREDQESSSQDMFRFTFSSANGGRRDRR